MKRKILFCGSFDPFTIGHRDIVDRALNLCDSVVIGIGINKDKTYSQSVGQRLDAIKKIFAGDKRVSVKAYEGLTADFAKRENIDFIVKGVRNAEDFEYEQKQAVFNREKCGVETLLLCADPALEGVSSTKVRKLLEKGEDCNDFLPV